MTYHSGKPYMGYAEFLYPIKRGSIEIIHFSTPVFRKSSIFLTVKQTVSEKSGKHLIYNYFIIHGISNG